MCVCVWLSRWVLVTVEGLIGWAKGGQWPYSQQQTVQGARYAFTSLLLLVAALFLLVTLSSGDASIPQPRHPGWTTMNHLLHPFVTMRYLETPPTRPSHLTHGSFACRNQHLLAHSTQRTGSAATSCRWTVLWIVFSVYLHVDVK